MPQPIVVVDAFTDRPFAGNPAAVCALPKPRDEAWMQRVAREMNLSETAFLLRDGDEFQLRWFTPAAEVALCGHATLASAHALYESGALAASREARFRTQSGLLTAVRRGAWIEIARLPGVVARGRGQSRRPRRPGAAGWTGGDGLER
jgi:PhzF family phenazine biosynthesis protein